MSSLPQYVRCAFDDFVVIVGKCFHFLSLFFESVANKYLLTNLTIRSLFQKTISGVLDMEYPSLLRERMTYLTEFQEATCYNA